MSNKAFNGVVDLNYVVSSVQADLDDFSGAVKHRLLHFAVKGLKKMNLFIFKSNRVAYLKVQDNNTVALPLDYIKYSKIGVDLGNGEVWTLTLNEDLKHIRQDISEICNPQTEVPPVELHSLQRDDDQFYPNYGYLFYHHFRGGQYVGELYGIGGGINVGEFRIDEEMRQIQFGSDMQFDEIILEYKSSGINSSLDTAVPHECVEALTYFIHWQLSVFDKTASLGDRREKKGMFGDAWNDLKRFTHLFTKDEYLDRLYEDGTQALNRG